MKNNNNKKNNGSIQTQPSMDRCKPSALSGMEIIISLYMAQNSDGIRLYCALSEWPNQQTKKTNKQTGPILRLGCHV